LPEKHLRQVVTAAADGATAAVAIAKYLEEVEEFEEMLQEDKLVLLAFWTPMNQFSIDAVSRVEQVMDEFEDVVKLFKIDMYRKQMMVQKFGISDPGTFVLVKKDETSEVLYSEDLDAVEAGFRAWMS